MSDVTVIVPVLGRPHRIVPLLASVEAATPAPCRVLFVASPDDEPTLVALDAAGADWVPATWPGGAPGDYMKKINLGISATRTPLLFLAADDLRFHPGWLAAATAKLADKIGVVGTNDLGNRRVRRGIHSTHSLVTRAYVDSFGTIDKPGAALHDGYFHNFCDDELVETAKRRRAWAFASDSIVEHLHPNWHKAEDDDVYRLGRVHFHADRRHYLDRRRLWT